MVGPPCRRPCHICATAGRAPASEPRPGPAGHLLHGEELAEPRAAHSRVVRRRPRLEFPAPLEGTDDDGIEAGVAGQAGRGLDGLALVAGERDPDAVAISMSFILERLEVHR